jgi:hypothetical protein
VKVACHRCSKPTDDLEGLCDECRDRQPVNESPYDDAAWRRTSKAFLLKYRWCELCGIRGLQVRATVADHWPRSRRELLAQGVADPDAFMYLRPLCRADHNARAASHTIRFDNDPA